MNPPKINANKLAKKEQLKHAAVLLCVLGACYGFYLTSSAERKKPELETPAHFDGVFNSKFNQDSDEALIKQQQAQIDSLKELVTQKVQNKEVISIAENEDNKALIETIQKQLSELHKDNKKMKEQLQVALLASQQASLAKVVTRPPTREEMEEKLAEKRRLDRKMLSKSGLETVHFNRRKRARLEERTPRNYVWAGTFAEGVLLTGILGDAGINGSKNMGTALIRLTSGGIMPNNQRSHLEDCSALVSTYGDLSGSSVILHLETLSCAGKDINFEQKVYGSVFDLDAMQDLRGTSILKTKPLLGYSAAAGMLAGIGDGLKNYNTAQSINPSVGTITTYGSATSLAQSAAGGALSNPANRISDYVMKIADIYHPLVVARAGRKVSVLFTKGFWIDKEHQVYESGKSIDEGHAQNETDVSTHISRLSDANQIAPSNPQESEMQANNNAEQNFLSQQGQTQPPLFSSIQTEEKSHD